MAEHKAELSEVLARLERVEKENRRLKLAGLLVLLVGAAVLVMGQAPPRRTLEAERFLLKDAKGNVRAELSMGLADRPTLIFFEAKGLPAVLLEGGDEPHLVLTRAGGNEQVSLHANRLFYGLALFGVPQGAARGTRAGLAVYEGTAGLTLYDEGGKERAALELTKAGAASFNLSDKEGFETNIGSTDLVRPQTGETHTTSAASIVLFGKDKKVLWSAP